MNNPDRTNRAASEKPGIGTQIEFFEDLNWIFENIAEFERRAYERGVTTLVLAYSLQLLSKQLIRQAESPPDVSDEEIIEYIDTLAAGEFDELEIIEEDYFEGPRP